MRKQKPWPLIMVLCSVCTLFLVIEVLRNVKIYIVYHSDIFPIIVGGLLLTAIVILLFRR